jgi:hypothetical protein
MRPRGWNSSSANRRARAGERLMVQAHGQVQATLGVMREMRECGGRIEDAVKVFDELPAAGEE